MLAKQDVQGKEVPVVFASRTLGAAEKNYSQLTKDDLAVVYRMMHFHQYIARHHATILADHWPLFDFFGAKKPIPPYCHRK